MLQVRQNNAGGRCRRRHISRTASATLWCGGRPSNWRRDSALSPRWRLSRRPTYLALNCLARDEPSEQNALSAALPSLALFSFWTMNVAIATLTSCRLAQRCMTRYTHQHQWTETLFLDADALPGVMPNSRLPALSRDSSYSFFLHWIKQHLHILTDSLLKLALIPAGNSHRTLDAVTPADTTPRNANLRAACSRLLIISLALSRLNAKERCPAHYARCSAIGEHLSPYQVAASTAAMPLCLPSRGIFLALAVGLRRTGQ